jgi:hypothetical protein
MAKTPIATRKPVNGDKGSESDVEGEGVGATEPAAREVEFAVVLLFAG